MKIRAWLPVVSGIAVAALSAPGFVPPLAEGLSALQVFSAVLALGLLLALFETSLYAGMTGKSWAASLEAVAPAYLPAFLLLAGWSWMPLRGFEPHDTPLRRAEIMTGLVWAAHLFWFVPILIRASLRDGRRSPAWVFGAAGAVLFLGLTLHTMRCDLSGDEPHYLLVAHSLWQDGDLDLSNNYASDDARRFYGRGLLEPQGNEHLLPDGRRYSHHPLGPSILFLPGYVLAGRSGAALTNALMAAGTLAFTLAALSALGYRRRAVIWMGWFGLFASPLFLYSGLLFAEISTAFVVSALLWAAAREKWCAAGLLFGLLPWMHNRNVILMIPVLVVLAAAWKSERVPFVQAARFLASSLVPLGLLVWYFHSLFGAWTPLGAHNEAMGSLFPWDRFFINFPGLLLDQEAGLWFYFPIFALVPAGAILGWDRGKGVFRTGVIAMVFYYLVMSFYQNLGLQPAARYFASVTPLLLLLSIPVLEILEKASSVWRRLVGILYLLSVALGFLLAVVPWMRYSQLMGETWVLKIAQKFTGIPWPLAEPSFHAQPVETRSFVLAWFWIFAVAGLTVLFVRQVRRGKQG